MTIQEEMLQSRTREVLSVLAGGVANKFNNALSTISGNADLIEMEFSGDEKIQKYVTPINESLHQMAHLCNQLLAYARGGKFNPEILSMTDFLKSFECNLFSLDLFCRCGFIRRTWV